MQLNENHLKEFRRILDADCILTDKFDLEPYNTDWLRHHTGKSRLALTPKSTDQVSQILKFCNDHKLAVVPQGGNTGLVVGR